MLQEGEKAAENKVKKLQHSKDEADAAITKLAQSRATDAKKQEHAQVCFRFLLGRYCLNCA